MAALFLYIALLISSPVLSVLTNHTIDDAGPSIQYLPSAQGICVGCVDPVTNFDVEELFNGTVTHYQGKDGLILTNFTGTSLFTATYGHVQLIFANSPGTALYVFFAGSSPNVGGYHQTCQFGLDGVQDPFSSVFAGVQYNQLVYENTAMPDGPHTFSIQMSAGFEIYLDYIVYTQVARVLPDTFLTSAPFFSSDDPETTAVLVDPSSTATSSAASTTISGSEPASIPHSIAPDTTTSAATAHKKRPVGGIAGGVVGGVVALLALAAAILFCMRARDKTRSAPALAEGKATPSLGSLSSPSSPDNFQVEELHAAVPCARIGPAEEDPRVLAGRVRQLAAQVQRLEGERTNARSSITSDTTSTSWPGGARSMSMMKRDQTRALREHHNGYTEDMMVRNSLVHTDSGLRMTAEAVNEVPPTYEAE
ncbi:hypothetical protein B0H13DRAFT_1851001 [Mycena leptocephala]|nr:hypothetical protein B0H13DRAFT_2327561 [Mycena leptocephala]KAJ7939265.1 hypothetical protein B0H13DRAFT_1851001 [Mycena leptocephala]